MNEIDNMNGELADLMGKYSLDPLGFAKYAFPWGEPGSELEDYPGLEPWQEKFLYDLGIRLKKAVMRFGKDKIPGETASAIRRAIASGHGIGKSALVAMIVLWAMSTRVNAKGVVTANTENQLKNKTWAELSKWHRLCITRHWFEYAATSISSKLKGFEKSWRIDATPWSINNTEAFAGLHNKGNRILVVFDEASAIPKEIWEVIEGALTDKDTEIMLFAFGNPTRSSGRFYDCFHKLRHRWDIQQIDSRTVSITDKTLFDEWVEDWGEDSDYVRVRVRGIFPRQSDRQFISSELVFNATKIKMREDQYNFNPVIIGVDAALYGDDEFTIYLRQGLFSKKLATARKIGDDFEAAAMVRNFEKEYNADAVFVDMGGGTGIVSAGRQMGRNWTLVPFGSESSDRSCFNKRAEMYVKLKEWLKLGGRIEPDPIMEAQLVMFEYTVKITKQGDKLLLESKEDIKKRGEGSPDRADGLALTFAYSVTKHMSGASHNRYDARNVKSYDVLKDVDENYDPLNNELIAK